MLTFVRLDENLDINYVYYSDTIRQEGDIEIPKECYLDAITFQKDENGQVIINRITEKEQELRDGKLGRWWSRRQKCADNYRTLRSL